MSGWLPREDGGGVPPVAVDGNDGGEVGAFT